MTNNKVSCVTQPISQCHLSKQKPQKYPIMPKLQDISQYVHPFDECEINVVYKDMLDVGTYRDSVKFKKFDDCVHYFTRSRAYFYFYINLLKSAIVFSAFPIAGGVKGVLGNHITIGFDQNGSLDIHETMYTVEEMRRYHIIANKKKREYSIDAKTLQLVSQASAPPHYAPLLWNDILRFVQNARQHDEQYGGASGNPAIMVTKRNPRPQLRYHELVAKVRWRIQKIAKMIQEDETRCAFVRVPYVSKEVESDLLRDIEEAYSDKALRTFMLITDYKTEHSILLVNITLQR
jgi:hypothetical protein